MNFIHSHFCEKENSIVSCSDKDCKKPFTLDKCESCKAEESEARDIPDWAFDPYEDYRDDYKDSLTDGAE